MQKIIVGIIAGTPVDTAFGEILVRSFGLSTRTFAVSATPQEQTLLQAGSRKKLTDIILKKILEWEMRFSDACLDLL